MGNGFQQKGNYFQDSTINDGQRKRRPVISGETKGGQLQEPATLLPDTQEPATLLPEILEPATLFPDTLEPATLFPDPLESATRTT